MNFPFINFESNVELHMSMKKHLVLLSIVLIVVLQNNSFGQNHNDILNQRIDLNLPQTTMFFALNKLAYQFQIPIGLERAADYRQKLKEKMIFENNTVKWEKDTVVVVPGTLKEILTSLLKQNPDYGWELNDGVINIFPVATRDKFLESFLNTKLDNFDPAKDTSNIEIRDYIIDSREVKSLLESQQVTILKRDYIESGKFCFGNVSNTPFSNSSIKAILNMIARKSSFKFWVIERIGENKENLLLTF